MCSNKWLNLVLRNPILKEVYFKINITSYKETICYQSKIIWSNTISSYLNFCSQLAEKNLMGDACQQSENTHIEKVWW